MFSFFWKQISESKTKASYILIGTFGGSLLGWLVGAVFAVLIDPSVGFFMIVPLMCFGVFGSLIFVAVISKMKAIRSKVLKRRDFDILELLTKKRVILFLFHIYII